MSSVVGNKQGVGSAVKLLMGETEYELEVVLSEDQIRFHTFQTAREICEFYRRFGVRRLVLIGILKGAFVYMRDLLQEMGRWNLEQDPAEQINLLVDFLPTSSYESDGKEAEMHSSGKVEFHYEVRVPITEEHVLLVEDVADTQVTLAATEQHLLSYGVASLKSTCVAVKDGCAKNDFEVDFPGIRTAPDYLVGYGLDTNQELRWLPFIAKVVKKIPSN